jgi:hypothetical protein
VNNSQSRIRIEIYPGGREGNEQWFWRARRRKNRKIIADGAEGYYKKGNARRAANGFMDALYDDLLSTTGGPEIVAVDK